MTVAGDAGPGAVERVRHVRQGDPNGCTIACTAMVTGQSYETVRDEWGHVGKGHDWLKWTTYLVNRGYAVQHLWKHDSERKADRPGWPLAPWTDVHLCAIDAGHGEGSHLIVLLRDGTVLDPATDAPRRWGEYGGVLHMTAVVKLARPATPGDGAAGLSAEVANLQARLAASEAERCKMADTAVAGLLEHNRMRWDAEERATAAEARAEAAERERDGARATTGMMRAALEQVEREMRAGLGSSYGETREKVRRALAAGRSDGGEHRANRGAGNDENPARDAVGRDGGGVGGVDG